MVLSFDGCGVSYVVESFNNNYNSWLKSICQGKQQIKKILELEEKDLTQSIPVSSTTNTNVKTHQVSIGSTMSPQILKGMMKNIANHPNICTQENYKLSYLPTLLSNDEFTGAPIDTHPMVVLLESIYLYKEITLRNKDLVQLDLTQRLLHGYPNCDENTHITCSCTKSKTYSANTTVETTDATNKMVDITVKCIMRNMDTLQHLFFTLNCYGYNKWLEETILT